jgi:hypothetical protein
MKFQRRMKRRLTTRVTSTLKTMSGRGLTNRFSLAVIMRGRR